MASRNYISDDFAAKVERARRMVQRAPQPHRLPPPPPPTAPIVSGMFRVYNAGTETIPESGVMQVEELSEQTGYAGGASDVHDAYSVVKPGKGGDNRNEMGTMYLINAGGEIKERHWGAGIFLVEPNKVLIDPDADPEFLDSFGPVEDEWHLGPTGVGYLWLGLTEEDEEEGTATAIFKEGLPPDGVLFRNDDSEEAPAYGVLAISGSTETNGNTVTTTIKPSSTFRRRYLANGKNAIASGEYGIGYPMNGNPVKVLYDTTNTPAYEEGWGPKPAEWKIFKGYYGYTILGNHDSTAATVWVTGEPISIVTAKTSTAHAKGATQSVDVFTADAATDTTWNISAKNAYCALATTKECEVSFIGNVYKLIAGDPST